MSDIRANVLCNIGRIISGSVSDSYVQNVGLIYTKGTLVLQGSSYVAVGTPVSINYEIASGGEYIIPRELFVLSSSANAFTNQVTVSIGCRLTMLQEVVPKPEAGDITILNPDILRCKNGNPKSAFPQPMMAQEIANYCAEQLGITCNSSLVNPYLVKEFDLTGGYLDLIGRLLLSESRVGYCVSGSTIQTRDLNSLQDERSTVGNDKIISWEPVNSGQIAPDRAISPYIHKVLEVYKPEDVLWEEDEFEGTEEVVVIRSAVPQPNDGNGNPVAPVPVSREVLWTPYWKSTTTYGDPIDLTDLCKPSTKPDLSNSVIQKVKEERQVLGVTATDYCAQLLSFEVEPNINLNGTAYTEEYYEYDDYGRPIEHTTIQKLPFFSFAGKLQLDWFVPALGEDDDYVVLGNTPVIAEQQIISYEYIDSQQRDVVTDGVDEELKPGMTAIKTLTRIFKAFGLTQQGEQYAAGTVQTGALETAEQLLAFVSTDLTRLVEVVTDIEFDRTTAKIKGQTRPAPEEIVKNYDTLDGQNRTTKYAVIESGSAGDVFNRSISYNPPFLPEAYLDENGIPQEFDTQSVAMSFVRSQSALTVGSRNGVSITTLPAAFGPGPLATVSVGAQEWAALGVANGMSWTFDGNGIVQTADIVLIAGSKDDKLRLRDGDTPDCWLPLPSGYDSSKVPTAPEYVRFIFERIPSEGGIKLGLRVNSELSNNLPPVGQQDVYTGLKLGLGGTALGDVIQYAYAGVAMGLDVSSESGVANAIDTGLKLGLNVEPAFDLMPKEVEIGVALGLNVGPSVVPNTVLLHFDNGIAFEDPGYPQTTAIDSSPSAHVFTTHGTNAEIYTNDEFQAARFGPSYMFFFYNKDDYVSNGGISASSSEFALNSTTDWTVEGWIYFDSFFKPDGESSVDDQFLVNIVSPDGNNVLVIQIDYDDSWNPYLVGWVFDDSFSFIRPNQAANSMLPLDQWVHFAFVHESGNYTLYQNGIRADYVPFSSFAMRTNGVNLSLGGAMQDGSGDVVSKFVTCLFDEFRIVNGKAIYTGANYVIPTGPFA